MNNYLPSLLFIFFLLVNTSSESYEIQTLRPDLEITVDSSIGMFYFDSSTFQIDDEIEFIIKASSFQNNQIKYKFIDNAEYKSTIDNTYKQTLKRNTYSLEANITKTIKEDSQSYIYNYYSFTKDSKKLDGSNGEYLIIFFECKGKVTIKNGKNLRNTINLSEPKTSDDGILKKYGTIQAKGSDGGIIFDSSDFEEGEDIFFKIKAEYFYDTEIYYEFVDDLSTYHPSLFYNSYHSTHYTDKDYESGFDIYYYTIKKDKTLLGNLEGKYLIIFFQCRGIVTITNTKENEGNSSVYIAIVVIIIVVIGIGVLIYYCCKRRKNAQINQNAQINNVQNMNQNNLVYNPNAMNQNNIIYNPNAMNQNNIIYNPNAMNQNNMLYNQNNMNQNNMLYNQNNMNQNNMLYNQNYNPNPNSNQNINYNININVNPNNTNNTKGYNSKNMNQNNSNYNNKGYSSKNINQNNNNDLNQIDRGYSSNNLNQNDNMDLNSKNQMNINEQPVNDNAAPGVGFISKP